MYDRDAGVELIKAQVVRGHHLCQHDDLSGVHRDGKRDLNRFPFFCLQARSIPIDDFLTGPELAESSIMLPPLFSGTISLPCGTQPLPPIPMNE